MSSRTDAQALARAASITAALREHCGWTARLTPQLLAPYLIEEAAEVSETVHQERLGAALASELGDVLFQILLHSQLGSERGDFALADVADALSDKLLRRNTHIFDANGELLEHPNGDPAAAERAWQAAKAAEREARGEPDDAADPLRGLPASLPALVLAQKALSRAGVGPSTQPEQEHAEPGTGDSAEEIGDALLVQVHRARAAGVDAERALRDALVRELSQERP